MTTTTSLLDAALDYERRGFSVIPLKGKVPCESWAEYQSRRATADEIRAWWERYPQANVGLVCGKVSGLMVLDVDPRNGGNDSMTGKEIPVTPAVRTGGGGWHYYYPCGNGTSCGKPLTGVDLKANGGYVVAPPSVHPETGKPYSWADGLSYADVPMATLPIWLSDLLMAQVAPKLHDVRVDGQASAPIQNGSRNSELTSLAGTMRRRGMTPSAIHAALRTENAVRCVPPLPDDEVESIAKSVGRYAPAEQPKAGEPEVEKNPPLSPADVLINDPQDLTRFKTGFQSLDSALRGGIPNKIITTIQGKPHVGKSALAGQIVKTVAELGYMAVVCPKDEGWYAASIRIGQQFGLSREKLEARDPKEFKRFSELLKDRKILIPDVDSPGWNLEAVIDFAEKESDGNPFLLAIDSVHKMPTKFAAPSIRESIDYKYGLLEKLARRCGGWVIATAELNRGAYKNKDDAMNSDPIAGAAESRVIEYTSRVVLHMTGKAQTAVNLEIVKNSPGGHLSTLFLKFDPVTASFAETSEDEADGLRDADKGREDERKRASVRLKIQKALANGATLNTRKLRDAVGGNHALFDRVLDQMTENDELDVSSGIGKERFYSLKGGTNAPF